MLDILTETFVYEFFIYQAIIGKFLPLNKIFACLKEIFCIKEYKNMDSLFDADIIKEIQTIEEYKRYRRVKQYKELTHQPSLLEEQEEMILAIKGKAMSTADKYCLCATEEMTKNLIERNLYMLAKQGNVLAMRVLGTLLCSGIFLKANQQSGLKYLEKATQWGDTFAALSLLKYDEENRREILKKLNASVADTPFYFLSSIVQEQYKMKVNQENEEILLLKKSFACGKLKEDLYEPLYARLIFGSTIGIKDKEKIVFSENKEMISEACDLPLKLQRDDILIREEVLEDIPIHREEEQQNLLIGLRNSDLRMMKAYKPIGIYSDSEYALEIYMKRIFQMLDQNHIEKIEVADLRGIDFEPTKNNVFIRNAEEGKANIYLFLLKGEIDEAIIDNLKSFLKSEKRQRFHLNHPAVRLDLSPILPICICDKENMNHLKNWVEFVKIAPIRASEKIEVIRDMLEEKKTSYHIASAIIDEQALAALNTISLDTVDKILDKILKEYRIRREEIHLTAELVRPYFEDKKINHVKKTYGFGGSINENH